MSDMRLRTIRIIDMGNPVPPLHGLFFSISSKRSCFLFPLFVELQLESDIDQCIRQEGSIPVPTVPKEQDDVIDCWTDPSRWTLINYFSM